MLPDVHVLDPLTDARWDTFLDRHPRASVFHSRGWLEALKRTYAYEPFALTTTPEGALENGLVVCRVKTWAVRRLVSLPFSDHCDPLVDTSVALSAIIEFLGAGMKGGRWRSLELRPLTAATVTDGGQPFRADDGPGPVRDGGRSFRVDEGQRFVLHTLDLRRPAADIWAGFHPSNKQRAIRRAEREGLRYEAGTSEELLTAFYALFRRTRRRHGLPPQPIAWFRNLIACIPSTRFARSGQGATIHLASKSGVPIAGILTLSFKKTMVYKYGGSDERYHRLGGMPFLFWQVIQSAIADGVETFDLGRSDLDQPGLLAFKDHLGAVRSTLTYYRHPARRPTHTQARWAGRLARAVASRLPDAVLDLSGRLLYRHLG